tara:strand:+ start:1442 stop:1918 length:477 start_codon:yes stop_codon:yes gene_type:complete
MNKKYWMSQKEYEFVISKTPIPCVDIIPLRGEKGIREFLLVKRKTGYSKGNWCFIGGRQWIGETLKDTLDRQAKELGVKVEVMPPFNSNFPAFIDDGPKQDKTKQACTHMYPVKIISGKLKKEGEEFEEVKWFSVNGLPKNMGYNRKELISKMYKILK